jgi:hypothetical protein
MPMRCLMRRIRNELLQTWWSVLALAKYRRRIRPLTFAVQIHGRNVEVACSQTDSIGRAMLCAALAERARPLFDWVSRHPNPFGRGRLDPEGVVARHLECLWRTTTCRGAIPAADELRVIEEELSRAPDVTADGAFAVTPGLAWTVLESLQSGWQSLRFPDDLHPAVDAISAWIDSIESFVENQDLTDGPERIDVEEQFVERCLKALPLHEADDSSLAEAAEALRKLARENPPVPA